MHLERTKFDTIQSSNCFYFRFWYKGSLARIQDSKIAGEQTPWPHDSWTSGHLVDVITPMATCVLRRSSSYHWRRSFYRQKYWSRRQRHKERFTTPTSCFPSHPLPHQRRHRRRQQSWARHFTSSPRPSSSIPTKQVSKQLGNWIGTPGQVVMGGDLTFQRSWVRIPAPYMLDVSWASINKWL